MQKRELLHIIRTNNVQDFTKTGGIMKDKEPYVVGRIHQLLDVGYTGIHRQNCSVGDEKTIKPENVVQHDSINHPSHYTARNIRCRHCGEPIECIDITENFNCNCGNVIKYVWRNGSKDDPIVDLKKSSWYILREIDRLERNTNDCPKCISYLECSELGTLHVGCDNYTEEA